MKDKEITHIIAEKVMGWKLRVTPFGFSYWDKGDGNVYGEQNYDPVNFHPLYRDNDCMMAWDVFVQNRIISNVEADKLFEWIHLYKKTGVKRRRAMCECMVAAVKESQRASTEREG